MKLNLGYPLMKRDPNKKLVRTGLIPRKTKVQLAKMELACLKKERREHQASSAAWVNQVPYTREGIKRVGWLSQHDCASVRIQRGKEPASIKKRRLMAWDPAI